MGGFDTLTLRPFDFFDYCANGFFLNDFFAF